MQITLLHPMWQCAARACGWNWNRGQPTRTTGKQWGRRSKDSSAFSLCRCLYRKTCTHAAVLPKRRSPDLGRGFVLRRRRCPAGPEQGGSRFPDGHRHVKVSSDVHSGHLLTRRVTRCCKECLHFPQMQVLQSSCWRTPRSSRLCDVRRSGAARCGIDGRWDGIDCGAGMGRCMGRCSVAPERGPGGCGRCSRSMSRHGDLPPSAGGGRVSRPSPLSGRCGGWWPLPCGGGRCPWCPCPWPPCGGRGGGL